MDILAFHPGQIILLKRATKLFLSHEIKGIHDSSYSFSHQPKTRLTDLKELLFNSEGGTFEHSAPRHFKSAI